jgi:Tfp pilus assembly protein PilZ
MTDKRRHRRIKRRLMVRYGEKDLARSGFTVDISAGGVFVLAPSVVPLDARVHLQIQVDAVKHVYFEGVVRRHKLAPPELRTIERMGFGVRFLKPDELFSEFSLPGAPRFELRFPTKEGFRAAYEREFKFGGAFITTPRKLARDEEVTIDVFVEYASRSFSFDAAVIQITPGIGENPGGVGVAFRKPQEVEASLKPLLA